MCLDREDIFSLNSLSAPVARLQGFTASKENVRCLIQLLDFKVIY